MLAKQPWKQMLHIMVWRQTTASSALYRTLQNREPASKLSQGTLVVWLPLFPPPPPYHWVPQESLFAGSIRIDSKKAEYSGLPFTLHSWGRGGGVHVGVEGGCPLPFKSLILRTLKSALQCILSDKGTNLVMRRAALYPHLLYLYHILFYFFIKQQCWETAI